jgi:hypothetical protein
MSDNTIINATVALVSIGDRIQIEGLKLEDGRYAIAQQQVASLFSVIPTSAPKWLKSLLGEGSQLFRVKTDRPKQQGKQNRPESALLIDDFRILIRKLDKKGNAIAERLSDILMGVALEQFFADAFDDNLTKQDRQAIANCILDHADPWKRLYEKQMCDRAFSWFGCSFYWQFCYAFFTHEERCKHEQLNPIMRGGRKYKIHQFLEPETRERLKPRIIELGALLGASRSKQAFLTNYANLYGFGWQQELDFE